MTNPTGYTELDLVGFTDKGEYSPSANYVQNDIVQYNYVAWRCKVDDTTGITPTEGTNWTVFVGNPPSTSVTGVKGNAESTYRSGNVNLTPANIGALATDGDSKDNTVTFTSSDDDTTTEKTSDGFTSVTTMASGENHASLFQKISKMFLNVRKLWNTVGTTVLDTTNFGASITAQLKNLTDGNLYSTSETWTGKYWIDGKKIYKKTYTGTFTSSDYSIAVSELIDTVIKCEFIATNNTFMFDTLTYSGNDTTKIVCCYYNYSSNKIIFKNTSIYAGMSTYVTLYYTKS